MTPGAKFSIIIRFGGEFLDDFEAFSDFRSQVTLFIRVENEEIKASVLTSSDAARRPWSPPLGFSTLTTSAPSQASAYVQRARLELRKIEHLDTRQCALLPFADHPPLSAMPSIYWQTKYSWVKGNGV